MSKVYIVSARRSAIGSFMGSLSGANPADFVEEIVKAVLADAKIKPEQVDELICGNILSAGLGQGIGRQISIKAGIPASVCAYSFNILCGSGMNAVINGMANIVGGDADIVVAGSVESMSSAPFLVPKNVRKGIKMGSFQVVDHMLKDALTDAFEDIHIGLTAENVAAKHGITREQQDAFSYASQQKAIKSVDEGALKRRLFP